MVVRPRRGRLRSAASAVFRLVGTRPVWQPPEELIAGSGDEEEWDEDEWDGDDGDDDEGGDDGPDEDHDFELSG